jgi:hypothetical protein
MGIFRSIFERRTSSEQDELSKMSHLDTIAQASQSTPAISILPYPRQTQNDENIKYCSLKDYL